MLKKDDVLQLFALVPFASTNHQVGDKSLTAREGSLSRTMKSSFSDLCLKFEDIRSVDRMAAVQARVFDRYEYTVPLRRFSAGNSLSFESFESEVTSVLSTTR